MPENSTQPEQIALIRIFRQSLSPKDRKAFDELLASAKKRLPAVSQSDLFQVIALLLSAQLSIYEELRDLKTDQETPVEPEKGRFLPFGEGGYSFFNKEQVDRFRSLGLDVNDIVEPTYGPVEE